MSRLIDADRLLSERMKSMYYHLPNGDIAVPLIDIENAPTIEERKPEWIPCSERLPAYGEDVILAIGEYCNVGYLVAVNDETDGEWYYSGWYHPMNDVSAWMPLPEPWKGEE